MPRTPSTRLLVTATVLALVATACSSGGDEDTASSPGSPGPAASAPSEVGPATQGPTAVAPQETAAAAEEAVTVTIEGFDYAVPESVAAGSEVTVVNNDREAHTFTLDGDAGVQLVVQGGASETFTAPAAGTYAVTCDFHGGMTAELVVS